MQRQGYRVHALIFLVALSAYLPGFWWGAPHATAPARTHSWGVDDETPLGPLAEIHNIIQPKPDRNLGYPLMYSFIVSAAYAPYLGLLWITGQLREISAAYPFGLSDPVGTLKTLTYIAHLTTVLMGTGVIVAAYEAARVLWGRAAGIVAALLSMTSYPMFYYSRTGNVDVPMLFFIALATAVYAHCLARGFTTKRAVLLGIFAGFALATKEQSVAALWPIPFIVLWDQWRKTEKLTGWSFWKVPVFGMTASVLAFGLGSGLFIEPSRYLAHFELIANRLDQIGNRAHFTTDFPFTMEGHIAYLDGLISKLVEMMTLPGLLLSATGMLYAFSNARRSALLPLIAITYTAFLFLALRTLQMRYLLPIPFALSFASAFLIQTLWARGSKLLRAAVLTPVIYIVGFGLLRGSALTFEMVNDSRYDAAKWLASRDLSETIEYFGPPETLPALREGVTARRTTDYFGFWQRDHHRHDPRKIEEILIGWRNRNPVLIVLVPDHTSAPEHPFNISCPPELCLGLIEGRLPYRQAASFKTPPLFNWLDLPELDYPTVNPTIRIFSNESMPQRYAHSENEPP